MPLDRYAESYNPSLGLMVDVDSGYSEPKCRLPADAVVPRVSSSSASAGDVQGPSQLKPPKIIQTRGSRMTYKVSRVIERVIGGDFFQ